MITKAQRDHFVYTWRHKMAFLKTEKQLRGRNTLRGYLHDADKLFLYLFLPPGLVSKMHTAHSRHHARVAFTKEDFVQMVIDWECAAVTKPDKPMNAAETLALLYPRFKSKIKPILKELGIDKPLRREVILDYVSRGGQPRVIPARIEQQWKLQ